jgi:hypothetical protein
MVDIQTGDVGPGSAPKILVLYLHRATRAAGASGMFASPGLNASFFVRGDHELIILQRLPFPCAGIQIENAAGFVGKVGIACAAADGSHQARLTNLSRQIRRTPA